MKWNKDTIKRMETLTALIKTNSRPSTTSGIKKSISTIKKDKNWSEICKLDIKLSYKHSKMIWKNNFPTKSKKVLSS